MAADCLGNAIDPTLLMVYGESGSLRSAQSEVLMKTEKI